MEGPTHPEPPKAMIYTLTLLMLITLGLCWEGARGQPSPHQVVNLSWVIGNLETGWTQVLANGAHSPGTWWPTLTFDLCQLAKDSWGRTEKSPHDSYPPCQRASWYICPGWGKRPPSMGGQKSFTVLNGDVKPILMGIGKPREEIS